jgi:drug/metabolite transporter (DMT)-like permease
LNDKGYLAMKYKIYLALLSIYIIWGSTYLAIRFAVDTLPPFLMAGIRFTIPGLIFYIWQRQRGEPAPSRFHWRSAVLIGFFLLAAGNGVVSWAEQRVVSGVTALLIGSMPVWMVLIDSIWTRSHRPTRATLAGVLLGLVGIVLLIAPSLVEGSENQLDLVGVLVVLMGTLSWTIGSLYSRSAVLPKSPLLGTGMEMLAGGLILLLWGTVTGEWSRLELAQVSTRSFLALLYLIVFGSMVGFSSYTWLLRNAPTPLVSTFAYVNPLIAVLLGSLLADEPLTVNILISALVIVSAVFLINTARSRPQPDVSSSLSYAPGDD